MDLMTTDTAKDAQRRKARVAVLPVGAFEQHGDHLPLITDTAIACIISQEVSATYPVLLLPPITLSCSHEHASWVGTVSISARTLHAVINDSADSLINSGIPNLVIVNGHGGNYVLNNVVQEANVRNPRMALFPTRDDWRRARLTAGMITEAHDDMHGGELETSILLYAAPHMVRPGYETADWEAPERPYFLSLGMRGYTTSGVIGRPSLASAEKGKIAVSDLVDSFAGHFRALTEVISK